MLLKCKLNLKWKELNRVGELYIEKHPQLKLKLVDGSSLAAAVVLHCIPQGTSHVLLVGKLNKVSRAVALALFHRDVKVSHVKNNSASIYTII